MHCNRNAAEPIYDRNASWITSPVHARMVDQLYEELMRWTPPCAAASTNASMAGGC
jgi:hypothetical protein